MCFRPGVSAVKVKIGQMDNQSTESTDGDCCIKANGGVVSKISFL